MLTNKLSFEDIFNQGGILQTKLDGYEPRPQQLRVARLIADGINSKKSVVVEAPTGVGKGFAYLIPIIQAGKRALISTSNKNLQDQLNDKDLPTLKKVLKIDFNWTVLKGKSNYFCQEQFTVNYENLERVLSARDIKAIARWAKKTKTGDLDTCPIELTPSIRSLIGHDPEVSHGKDGSTVELCFASLAKERVKESQIILINHTLLTLDIAMRKQTKPKSRGFLPKVDVIVVDEAHALEKCASMAFSEELSYWSLKHFFDSSIVKLSTTKKNARDLLEKFSIAITKYLPTKPDGYYYKPMKVKNFEGFEEVMAGIDSIVEKIKSNSKIPNDELNTIRKNSIIKEGENLTKRLMHFASGNEEYLFWSEAYDGKRGTTIKLLSAPITVAKLLGDYFNKRVVVFTSATLSTNGNFDYFKEQIGLLKDTLELVEQSPFDFTRNSLAFITQGQGDKIKEVEQLLKYSKGRAFVLFTSFREMYAYYENINIPYKKLIQSQGISKSQLLKEFRETDNAVLFATKSFWEGVDVRGDKLSMVIIHKIPFANPSDLLYQSKIEQLEKKHGKGAHWSKLTIPEACISLKQGFGRLIRSKTDSGVYVLMDERVITANYRNPVLRTLPADTPRTQKIEKVKEFFENRPLIN